MAKLNLHDPKKTRAPSHPHIESALRTFEAEAGGFNALVAAIHDGLGKSFIAAVELIRQAKGRVIVTGMGKSGHVARKIAATLASTGTPAFFVHPGEASHGDLGMITPDDVIMALSWSGETTELKDLIDYSRRFRIGLVAITADAGQHARQVGRRGAGAAAGPRGVPAQSRADHVLADAACARRCAGDRPAGKPRLHRGRFRPAASRRPARRAAEVHPRRHDTAANRSRSPRSAPRCRTRCWRCRPRASAASASPAATASLPASSPTAICAATWAPTLLDARVDEVMTRSPKTVRPDQLVSETLEILNATKITALFVVEAGRPVGIVHIHDLLRAGAA